MSKPNGGPAFPTHIWNGNQQGGQYLPVGGMSLRDYFAAKAMVGMLANAAFMQDDSGHRNNTFENYAVAAYMQADSMLKAREA